MVEKYEIGSNIINEGNDTNNIIHDTLEFLNNALIKTLGPYGSNTIIQDRLGQHYLTKDGYTVLKNIRVTDAAASTIIDIVKGVSRDQVRTVGDGSTSSIVVANHLYNGINKFINERPELSKKDIIDILHEMGEFLKEKIKDKATPVTEENLHDIVKLIATVSTNNDEDMGTMIADIYSKIGPYGFINLEKSLTSKDHFEITSGFELNRGYINPLFANQPDKETAIYDNPLIFMSDSTLNGDDLEFLAELLGHSLRVGKPLLVIAQDYTSDVKVFFHENKMNMRDKLNVVAIDIATESVDAAEQFDDLAIAVGAAPLRKSDLEKVTVEEFINDDRLGTCERIEITLSKSFIINPLGDKDMVEGRAEYIRCLLHEIEQSSAEVEDDIFDLRSRLASLTNSNAVLYIGGNTEVEKENNKFLIEDAIYACQSTIRNGYIVGGNLIVPKLLNDDELKEELIKHISSNFERINRLFKVLDTDLTFEEYLDLLIMDIKESFLESYSTVLKNADLPDNVISNIIDDCLVDNKIYNLKTNLFEYDKDTHIINSAETDIQIIDSTFSIIGLLINSNQFLGINEIIKK